MNPKEKSRLMIYRFSTADLYYHRAVKKLLCNIEHAINAQDYEGLRNLLNMENTTSTKFHLLLIPIFLREHLQLLKALLDTIAWSRKKIIVHRRLTIEVKEPHTLTGGNELTHYAAKYDNTTALKMFMDQGIPMFKANFKGESPFFTAIRHGSINVIKMLLSTYDNPAAIYHKDKRKEYVCPLLYSIQHYQSGRPLVAALLLDICPGLDVKLDLLLQFTLQAKRHDYLFEVFLRNEKVSALLSSTHKKCLQKTFADVVHQLDAEAIRILANHMPKLVKHLSHHYSPSYISNCRLALFHHDDSLLYHHKPNIALSQLAPKQPNKRKHALKLPPPPSPRAFLDESILWIQPSPSQKRKTIFERLHSNEAKKCHCFIEKPENDYKKPAKRGLDHPESSTQNLWQC